MLQSKTFVPAMFRLFLLVIPALYFTSLVDPVLIPRQLFLNIYLILLFIFIFFHQKELPIDFDFFLQPLVLVSVGWIAANFLSGIGCVNTAEWINGVSKYALYILFFLLISVLLLTDQINLRQITISMVLLAAIIVAIAFIQIFMQLFQSGYESGINVNLITSSLANKNLLSSCLFLLFPFLFIALDYGNFWKRFSMFTLVMALIIILIIQTKAVWLACLLFVLILFFIRLKHNRREEISVFKSLKSPVFLFLAFAFVVSLIYAIRFFYPVDFFSTAYNFNTVNTRFLLWQNTLAMIRDHLIQGVGIGNWQIWFPHEGLSGFSEPVANGTSTFQRPHNDFLWVFSESGLAGFLFYLLIFFLAVRNCFRLAKNSFVESQRKQYLLFAATIFGYALISFVDFPLERIEHNVIFFSILAVIATDTYRHANKATRKKYFQKKHLIVGILFLFLTATVAGFRFKGETHTHQLIMAHGNQNWNGVIHEKKMSSNIFYNLDAFSIPLSWYSGVAYFNLNDLLHATQEFEAASLIHPFNIHVLNNLASCYEKNNRHHDAIELYTKALEISPSFRECLLNLSGAYFNSKDFENAFITIDRCSPDSTDPQYIAFLMPILQKKAEKITGEISSPVSADEKILMHLYWESKKKGVPFENLISLKQKQKN